jgi:hypothetical protein
VRLPPLTALSGLLLPLLLPPRPLGLSLPLVQGLLRALLPLPVWDAAAALAWIVYHQRHKWRAYWAHRRKRLRWLLVWSVVLLVE